MGALDDPATRELAFRAAGQIASLALESIQGRKLKAAESAAVLAAVRKVQAERVFTPTDQILGSDESGAKNADTAGAPDGEA